MPAPFMSNFVPDENSTLSTLARKYLWEPMGRAAGNPNVQALLDAMDQAQRGIPPAPGIGLAKPALAAAPFFLKRVLRYGSEIPEAKMALYNAYLKSAPKSSFAELIVSPIRGKTGKIDESLTNAKNLLVSALSLSKKGELDRSPLLGSPQENTGMVRDAIKFLASAYPKAKRVVGDRRAGMAPGHEFKANLQRVREALSEEQKQQILSDIMRGVEK